MVATPTQSFRPMAPRASHPLRRLPAKILDDAAARSAQLGLPIAVLTLFAQLLQRWAQPGLYAATMNNANRLAFLAAILWAVGLLALYRYRVVGPSIILSLGMTFEVLGAFALSMLETAVPLRADQPLLGVSSIGVWIVLFGLCIPNRPLWTLILSLAAAATWPLAYAINATVYQYPPAPWGVLSVWSLVNGAFAVLTYLIARQTIGLTLASDTSLELGSYRLVAPIGEGGVGEVWRAHHQLLARPAAIKLIGKQTMSGRQGDVTTRRFQREAEAIASLQSPHTVYLYDFGISDDGRFYYAMELLDGISLQSLVDTFGPQPASRVIPILLQICRSLEEAHRQGLIHRDVKPSNAMLCKVALTYDFVKVLDFGLAKFSDRPEFSQLTMTGTSTGTPGYIAPEVATGQFPVDPRADIYALGCVAYFLLTGTQVFDDANPMKMVMKHVRESPVPPSARTKLPIPEPLERIVLQCLAKTPSERPARAAQLAAMLSACAVDRWTDEDAEAWWTLHLPVTSRLRSHAAPLAVPPVVRKIAIGEA